MPEPEPPPKPPMLDYATPSGPGWEDGCLGCLGAVFGLIGAAALALGLGWAWRGIFSRDPFEDRPGDWMKAVPLGCIGIVCAIAAIRWIRDARRG